MSYLRFIHGGSLDEYKTHFPDYESYADDTEGHWYVPTCLEQYMAEDDDRDFEEVQVSATAGSTTATITATASMLTLQSKDGTATCTGFGIPWSQDNDARGTDCKIIFNRSSAHFKDSTTPVDVKVSYAISYTASDGATGTMDTHITSTTTTIPVAEIQAINTRPSAEP
ncbi:hypothetical protein [Actinomyces sp. 565]|uniref:hypothetical protein n=1 Tax=Actinomyces sp. 565 TaxID=2057794 RepID=UPI0013A7018A|nr:hypothetical protein [Actinomyces sp. 565]NDR54320.1 hypothetical protein [Actinomyces sp. 565]